MSAEAVHAASLAFKKALIERALGAEMSHHLGYSPEAAKPEEAGNHRNGRSAETVLTEDGPLRIEVPRDRAGSFEPILIPSTSGASPALTTRSSPCTRAAWRCARSRPFWPSSTPPRCLRSIPR